MCGIIGYIGKENGFKYSMEGLKMLQNRGYDSCGCCSINKKDNKFINRKYANKNEISSFDILEQKSDDFKGCEIFINHNRWKTNGPQTDDNAHPHIDFYEEFSLVHNGIIENYALLKEKLIKLGYKFKSQTDTEVIVNMISYYYKESKNVKTAIQKALQDLDGTYALCIICKHTPNIIYCTRRGSPLLVSVNDNFGMIASESSGFCGQVNNYICLDNNDLCLLSMDNNDIITMECERDYIPRNLNKTNELTTYAPYPHWTIKEINDQVEAAIRAMGLGGRILNDSEVKLGGLDRLKDKLINLDNIILLGCGTSYHACLEGAIYLKEICKFNTVQVFDGSEFTNKDIPRYGKTGVILVSQSGETLELYRCMELFKNENIISIGVINVVDSLIAREVDCGVYLNAGREFAVASTKAFTSQVIVLSMIAVWFAQNNNINEHKRKEIITGLRRLNLDISHTIEINKKNAKEVAKYLKDQTSVFILGKGISEPCAKEGSLKIKEIGYIHAESYGSSALKHGPYSLIMEGTPIIILTPNDEHFMKNDGIVEQISSRHGYIIGISDKKLDSNKYKHILEISKNKSFRGLLSVIPMQLIAYEMAIQKGHNPDYPRNLAKCVTTD
jgi:glucosamine--fructose-6-phosphate aminotransferase (isomerizing)